MRLGAAGLTQGSALHPNSLQTQTAPSQRRHP
jgi:hypothetical protein